MLNMGVIAMGMRNRLSKPRRSIDENLIERWQRYAAFNMKERKNI
jgi:hypothetical protein